MYRKLVLLLMMIVVGGCATRGPSLSENHRAIVAKDFVNALEMLDGAEPRATTVQTLPTDSKFGKQLINEMRSRGYGIQLVKKDQYKGPMFVSYSAERFEDNEAESVAYRVRIGRTELGREYEVRGDQIFPITALSVIGIRASTAPLDNSIFKKREALIGNIREQSLVDRDPIDDWQPVTAHPIEEKPLVTVVPVVPELGIPEPLVAGKPNRSMREPGLVKENVYELGESNFTSVLGQYRKVNELILVFPNDSLVFGRRNKDKLREFIQNFDTNTEVVSLIGCSHGKTNIENGNEFLATGRANRVKEALILAQIPADKILDEGCWANEPARPLPSRGVVVSVHRKNVRS